MTEVVRYKKGEGAIVRLVDWSRTEVHAIGRPAIGDLLCACLDKPFVNVEFRQFEFDAEKVKPNGIAKQLKAVVTVGDDPVLNGDAIHWRRDSRVTSLKGYGITTSMTCLGIQTAKEMVACAVDMAKPGDRVAIVVQDSGLPEKDGRRSPKRVTIQRMI